MRRFTWILLSQNAQVIGVDATSLTVGLQDGRGPRLVRRRRQRGDPAPGGDRHDRRRLEDRDRRRPVGPAGLGDRAAGDSRSASPAPRRRPSTPPPSAPAGLGERRGPVASRRGSPAGSAAESIAAARSNIAPTRNGDEPAPPPAGPDPDADAHRDDPAADDNGLDSTELLAARARRHRDRRDPPRLTA